MKKKPKLYKFLRTGLKSDYNGHQWVIGKWYQVPEELRKDGIQECRGFNCSARAIDALFYVKGKILAEVEVKGKSHIGKNKQTWEWMRVINIWEWEKSDSVGLAIFAAELVIDNFEKKYPNDKRPRQAIEAAKRVLQQDNKENRDAAYAAANAAYAAAYAPLAANAAVYAAANAAANAAYAATDAAYANAYATNAAYAATAPHNKTIAQCEEWIINRLKEKNGKKKQR